MKHQKKKVPQKFQIIIIIFFLILLLQLRENEIKNKFLLSLKMPKISVFLPIYNKEDYLIDSINSIQRQTINNIEIVAVNDGSTDNTLKILKKLSKKDKRIKIINNDRNHGLLYSRAMGIINSKGEYLMNLDPDDKFESKNNLELLYNKAKKSNLDFIRFLLKRIPRNNYEIKICNLKNKLQLLKKDYYITNKIIKKEIFLMAYNFFYKEIYKYKWNYHEDNIWNILTRKFSKKSEILNKYIYLYKRNEDSLNMDLGNLIEIKNRIYRLETLIKINQNDKSNNNYNNKQIYYQYFSSIINSCHASILKDNEIKKKLIGISIKLINIYNNNKKIIKNFNNKKIINIISDNKIILFYNSLNRNLFDYLTYLIFYNIFTNNNLRKIISVDINDMLQTNRIIKYIFSNDILFGLNDILFHKNFLKIINGFNKNKIIIFYNNQNVSLINNNNLLNNSFNYISYSFNQNTNDTIRNKLYSVPLNIMNYANYFNYIDDQKKKNYISILLDNNNNDIMSIIKKIFSKYYSSQFICKIYVNYNMTYLKRIIKKSKILITDNIYLMKLSILYFTSCIVYGNKTENSGKLNNLLFNLNYVKFINDINELEKKIIELKNRANNFDIKYKNINQILNIFN